MRYLTLLERAAHLPVIGSKTLRSFGGDPTVTDAGCVREGNEQWDCPKTDDPIEAAAKPTELHQCARSQLKPKSR